jgi:hypothetical protein
MRKLPSRTGINLNTDNGARTMDVFRLIEDNGLTLHGDIEHFAELVAEQERKACCQILESLQQRAGDWHNYYAFAIRTIEELRGTEGDSEIHGLELRNPRPEMQGDERR